MFRVKQTLGDLMSIRDHGRCRAIRSYMNRQCSIVLTLIVGLCMSTAAFAASVGGLVANSQGQPVSGVTIVAKDTSGKVLGEGTTSRSGVYDIKGLKEGNYNFTLDPGST